MLIKKRRIIFVHYEKVNNLISINAFKWRQIEDKLCSFQFNWKFTFLKHLCFMIEFLDIPLKIFFELFFNVEKSFLLKFDFKLFSIHISAWFRLKETIRKNEKMEKSWSRFQFFLFDFRSWENSTFFLFLKNRSIPGLSLLLLNSIHNKNSYYYHCHCNQKVSLDKIPIFLPLFLTISTDIYQKWTIISELIIEWSFMSYVIIPYL